MGYHGLSGVILDCLGLSWTNYGCLWLSTVMQILFAILHLMIDLLYICANVTTVFYIILHIVYMSYINVKQFLYCLPLDVQINNNI